MVQFTEVDCKKNIRTDLKLLKQTGRCKVFLDFDKRAAVTFGPPTQTVEGKLPIQRVEGKFGGESVEGTPQKETSKSAATSQ